MVGSNKETENHQNHSTGTSGNYQSSESDYNNPKMGHSDMCERKSCLWALRCLYVTSVICLYLSVWCILALSPPMSEPLLHIMGFLRKCLLIELLSDFSAAVSGFFQQGSLNAVVQIIGSTTTSAWIITAADRKILGVPIGQLIEWAYPGTFKIYSFCFIPLVLIGVFVNNAVFPESAFYSTAGTILLYFHFMRVCMVMLLSPNRRERIVYSFYMDRLRRPPPLYQPRRFQWDTLRRATEKMSALLTWKSQEVFGARDGGFSKGADPAYLPSAILHRVMECARSLMEEEHHMNSEPTFAILYEAIKKAKSPHKLDQQRLEALILCEINGHLEDELKSLLMCLEAWSVLLRDPMSDIKRQQAARRLLVQLEEPPYGSEDPSWHPFVLGGLALALRCLLSPENGMRSLVDICGPLKPMEIGAGTGPTSSSSGDRISYELTGQQQRALLLAYGYTLFLTELMDNYDQSNTSFESSWKTYRTFFPALEENIIPPINIDSRIDDGYQDVEAAIEAAKKEMGHFVKLLNCADDSKEVCKDFLSNF